MSLRAVLHTLLGKILTQIIQIFQHQTVELFAQIGGWRKMSPLSWENVFRARLRIHPAAAPPSPDAAAAPAVVPMVSRRCPDCPLGSRWWPASGAAMRFRVAALASIFILIFAFAFVFMFISALWNHLQPVRFIPISHRLVL